MKRAVAALIISGIACSVPIQENEVTGVGGFGGVELQAGAPTGKQYCVGHCFDDNYAHPYNGWFCFCDASCLNLGDCCPDMFTACGCRGWCGMEHPTGCHCDAACENLGDCCPRKQDFCG